MTSPCPLHKRGFYGLIYIYNWYKKGIADLQPHNYIRKKADSLPLRKIFSVVLEQHTKNTASLLGSLALLHDKLIELDPSDIKHSDLPY